MFISVVVPAFNEERLLGETLQSILRAAAEFETRGWKWELIVCDNNSTDTTAGVAGMCGARLVFEPVNQIGRARNTGARVAQGEWLLFIDADSRPEPGLFSDVSEAIESGRYLAGGSTVYFESTHRAGLRATRLWNWLSTTFRLLAGSFIFCKADAFREVGGFDERLYASEEIDLTRKLKRLARKRGKALVILTRHPLWTSDRKLHLYSMREHAWFITKTVFSFSRTLRRREHCATWYDGRR